MSAAPTSVVAALRRNAERGDDTQGFTHHQSEGPQHVGHASLARRAQALARALAGRCGRGDRVLLLSSPGPAFVEALCACWLRGAVAVPLQPPITSGRGSQTLERLSGVVRDCAPALGLADEATLGQLPELKRLGFPFTTVGALSDCGDDAALPDDASEGLALLQYTSGSTGAPRGVKLSHQNLAANCRAIIEQFEAGPECISVSWLPPYHDMGLVGHLAVPLVLGSQQHLMSPLRFVQRPLEWLKLISQTRATVAGCPSFAYEWCVRRTRPEQRAQLDLSHWQVAYCGAEPVRAPVLKGFGDAFAVAGFRPRAFMACYGLAEATLLVTGAPKGQGLREATLPRGGGRATVSCGAPGREVELRVVDPERRVELPQGEEGELWVRGPSVAEGYWGCDDAAFGGRLVDGRGPFLRTGDIGVLDGSGLHVVGRLKDVLVIDGLKHHAADLEATVERLDWGADAARLGRSAAFAVDDARGEFAVFLQEVRRPGADRERFVARIVGAISGQHGVGLKHVELLEPGTLPLTLSGKVRRSACRQLWLEGRLKRP